MAKPLRHTQEMIEEFVSKGYWDCISIADELEKFAKIYPSKEALIDSEKRLSWSQLNQLSNSLALGFLQSGFEKDDVVIIQIPSSVWTITFMMAFQKTGIIYAISPITLRHREMSHIIKKLKAKGLIIYTEYRNFNFFKMAKELQSKLPSLKYIFTINDEKIEGAIPFKEILLTPSEDQPLSPFLPDRRYGPFEVSTVVFSSGTTGLPKCIEYLNAALKASGKGIIKKARLTHEDTFGIIAPLSGGPGLHSAWAGLQIGAKIVLQERFDPEQTARLIQEEKISFLSTIPTQIIRILKEVNLKRYDLHSLRAIRTGGAAFDSSLAIETEEKFGCKVLLAGGSQETSTFAHTDIDDPPDVRLKTLGKVFPGNELKIVDNLGNELTQGEIGELYVRGAPTCSGYYHDITVTKKAWGCLGPEGWFKTGDFAKLDTSGNLILVGRKKEMILRGGQNIFPREIEELLMSHLKVKTVAVVGIPDSIMGERVCACVIPKQGENFSFEEMVIFLKGKGLAVHKLPERLEIMENFPNLAEGQKIDKKLLIEKIIKRWSMG